MLDTSETTLHSAPEPTPRTPAPRLLHLDDDEDDLGAEARAELLAQYEDSLRSLGEGEIVRGTVLSVDDKDVLVDVGFKSEGIIALSEFPDPSSIKVGDSVMREIAILKTGQETSASRGAA